MLGAVAFAGDRPFPCLRLSWMPVLLVPLPFIWDGFEPSHFYPNAEGWIIFGQLRSGAFGLGCNEREVHLVERLYSCAEAQGGVEKKVGRPIPRLPQTSQALVGLARLL